MNLFKTFLLTLTLLVAATAWAQPEDPCNLPPGEFRTQTQGGWGQACNGNNTGCLRDNNFDSCIGAELVLGDPNGFTLTLTSAAALVDYLDVANGTPGVLGQSYTDPIVDTEAGTFGAQLAALAMNLWFSNCGVANFNQDLAFLVVPIGWNSPFGFPAGWSVQEIYDLANMVLGGTAALPAGISLSDLNDILTAINENFVDGEVNNGYLVGPECDEILPVNVTSFTAVSGLDVISVRWQTASESAIEFYELSRMDASHAWTRIATVASQGDNPSGFHYVYDDHSVETGVTYTYRLTVHELDGSVTTYGNVASATPNGAAAVTEFALLQNYPNPFNPTTSIAYHLTDASHVRLTVFDLTGREIATLVNGDRAAGAHTVNFDAAGLAAGVYLYRIDAGSFTSVRKMMLLK